MAHARDPDVIDDVGIQVQLLTSVGRAESDFCVIRGTFPTDAIVGLHGHPERETFCFPEGELEAVHGGVKHEVSCMNDVTFEAGISSRVWNRTQADIADLQRRYLPPFGRAMSQVTPDITAARPACGGGPLYPPKGRLWLEIRHLRRMISGGRTLLA
jgi:hypothetical protein